ncbi:hypothetical protein BS17DRAFT_471247 [Gyrodon lividus]|nr:hypothetical protein BS17DRAFT_471247 [Gyrodon lividus]
MDQPTELQRITQGELAMRNAAHDGRRTKKRATDDVGVPLNMCGRQDLKRKERYTKAPTTREVIEVSSDSEPEVSPTKRQKVDNLNTLGSHFNVLTDYPDEDDDGCINLLASLNISNEANWVPPPTSNKAEDLTQGPDVIPPKPQTLPPLPVPKPKPPVDYSSLPLDWYSLGQWGMIARNCGITNFPKPFYYARRHENIFRGSKRSPRLYYDQGYNKLELIAKYPHLTSGSINKIIQTRGKIVLGAAVSAGSADYSDDEDDQPPPPPENRAGSLVVCDHGRVHIAQAHCHTRMSSRGPTMKYYSVNDVAFNPFNSAQILSSGHDFVVRLWEIPDRDADDDEGLRVMRDSKFDEIHFFLFFFFTFRCLEYSHV